MAQGDTKYVHGVQKLRRRLDHITEVLDLPSLTDSVEVLLLARTRGRFESESDPLGVPWRKLKNASLTRKIREGYPTAKILTRTGDLKNAIHIINGGLLTMFTNTGAGFRIGIDDPRILRRARPHQKGIPPQPQRRFLGIGPADVKAVDGLLRRKARQLEQEF